MKKPKTMAQQIAVLESNGWCLLSTAPSFQSFESRWALYDAEGNEVAVCHSIEPAMAWKKLLGRASIDWNLISLHEMAQLTPEEFGLLLSSPPSQCAKKLKRAIENGLLEFVTNSEGIELSELLWFPMGSKGYRTYTSVTKLSSRATYYRLTRRVTASDL